MSLNASQINIRTFVNSLNTLGSWQCSRCEMNQTLDPYAQALEERVAQSTFRLLRSSRPLPQGMLEISGKTLLNLASNDYLGLSQDSRLIERAQEYARKYGVGSGASRLISGNLRIYDDIEAKLASLKGSETALILPGGYQTNSSLIPTLLNKSSTAAADKLVHRSMLEGLRLSESKWFRYKHGDLQNMQAKLASFADSKTRWLFTETVFSMDGDCSDFDELISVSQNNDMRLYVDEAHATGVLGKNGMGLSAGKNFSGISMGTFGKGLGSFGSYICCSSLMREFLINFCPGLIYSTALPPPVLGAIDAALDLVPEMEEDRARLLDNASYLRTALNQSGFETGTSSTQIIPIIVGSTVSALNLSAYLEGAGFFIPAIRPPTVPDGSARLRVSLSSVHTKEQIDRLIGSIRRWHEKED